MNLRKAAEMALEVLEELQFINASFLKCDKAAEALRQVLAQPEQEPVGYVTDSGTSAYFSLGVDLEDETPLYTAPPKREWVGLTDGELPQGATYEFDRGVRWAEAKLKEKNT